MMRAYMSFFTFMHMYGDRFKDDIEAMEAWLAMVNGTYDDNRDKGCAPFVLRVNDYIITYNKSGFFNCPKLNICEVTEEELLEQLSEKFEFEEDVLKAAVYAVMNGGCAEFENIKRREMK